MSTRRQQVWWPSGAALMVGDAVAGGAVTGAAEARAKILPLLLSCRQCLSSFLLPVISTLPKIFMSLHNSRCMPFFWVICLVPIVYQKFQLSTQFNRALSSRFCSMLGVAKGTWDNVIMQIKSKYNSNSEAYLALQRWISFGYCYSFHFLWSFAAQGQKHLNRSGITAHITLHLDTLL